MEQLKSKIELILRKQGKRGMPFTELRRRTHVHPKQYREFEITLRDLMDGGTVTVDRGRYTFVRAVDALPATITKVAGTFGFAKLEDESEIFIPGRFLRGSMPGDEVLVATKRSDGPSPEGQVLKIIHRADVTFTGKLIRMDSGRFAIETDQLMREPILLEHRPDPELKLGDKVLCRVSLRGEQHRDHRAEIVAGFGSSNQASSCIAALLEAAGVVDRFDDEVALEAENINEQGVCATDLLHRLDLREDCVFTIDGADSLDLDDAISLTRTDKGFRLGVHIADVSHYVLPFDPIDTEAYERATSIYFGNRVIPMLPKALSNGICSLHADVDRLALSVFLELDKSGQLQDFQFAKTVIRSRVKGVYDEINAIYDGTATAELLQKYSAVAEVLPLMKELATLRMEKRAERGVPEIMTEESKAVLDEAGVAIDVVSRKRGFSQEMIEEFMLLANEAAAKLGKREELPFLYRVHEPPTGEKVDNLTEVLRQLGLSAADIAGGATAPKLAQILASVMGTPLQTVIHTQVLRTMSKAQYSNNPIGHFGLVLDDYAHFTSPIRRYPDLVVHRMITAYLAGQPTALLQKRYKKFVEKAGKQSTEREIRAMKMERDCTDRYKAEFMQQHVGEWFDGVISGTASHGIYVQLPNTVEGMIRIEDLPQGRYNFDGAIQYTNEDTGMRYRIGDPLRIQCVKSDVNSGRIDFAVVEGGNKTDEVPAHDKKKKHHKEKSFKGKSPKGKGHKDDKHKKARPEKGEKKKHKHKDQKDHKKKPKKEKDAV